MMHWTGIAWKQVPSHLPPGLGNLRGVAATSAGNAWAVGCTACSTSGAGDPVIVRWNGGSWTKVPVPRPAGMAGLDGVAATSPTDAWAVGVPAGSPGQSTGIMHWDGASWRLVPSRNPGGAEHVLAVTAVSPTYAWAVGETEATTPFEGVNSGRNGIAWD